MATLSLDKLRRTRLGKALSAVALVAWLTAAMQPCLMAMELVQEPAAAAHGHGAGHAMHGATDTEPCDSTLFSGCDLFPDVQLDSRAKVKFGGGEVDHPPQPVAVDWQFASEPALSRHRPPATDSSIVAAGPPLTIRYCSFLE